ncbi:ESX-1 associated ATP-binding protein EpsI N-terminal domain-containing protein, partial [Mycobacterium tuberculosis]|uniref:ESX-1 associated ATP-binding protein EpsI N-terminal domain-containing protein n=1 Tax=Mycobacterium tuberculosis TaxID=1773 RepID=UPI00403F69A3
MAADYDKLFRPHEGMEAPDDMAAQPFFDPSASFPPAPASANLPKPNGQTPPRSVVRPGTQTVWTERAGVRRLASLPRAVLVRCAGVDVARARVRGAPVIPVAAALRLAFVVSVVWGAPTG